MFAPSSLSSRARRSLLRRQHAVQADSDFTRLLDSVLGSPFLTTHDLPDLDVVDGSFQAVPTELAVTRPSSPDMANQRLTRFIDDGLPLDGEEGELIDDEACFIDVDYFTTAVDIVARLPPELSIHILTFLDLDSIIACLAVSRIWRIYAQDNAVWRGLFFLRTDWRLDLSRARFSAARTRRVSYVPSVSPELPPLSLDWWLLYKSRTQLDNRWQQGKAKMTRISGHSDSVYCLEFDSKTNNHWLTRQSYQSLVIKDRETIGFFQASYWQRSLFEIRQGLDIDNPFAPGFMVSGSSDCSIIVWNLLANGRRAEVSAILPAHMGGVLDLRIDDKHIVSCSKDTWIRVWDRSTLGLLTTFEGHQGPVNAVGLQGNRVVSASGDGKGLACIEFKGDLIVSGSNDCKIKLVRALSFDPVTGRLVSASYDKSIKVWDLNTGKLITEFKNSHVSHIFDVKFDLRRIVSTSHDQKIVVLNFSEGLDTACSVTPNNLSYKHEQTRTRIIILHLCIPVYTSPFAFFAPSVGDGS
ncbi:WD40 repeat-like protein [Thelephora terrestris]|uniref:WD40 repeat-like protein n=1 Tax=Thelephora terrestris TaxID=56493 RepID=A0A9P6L0Y0_9AGAM|nr:WD40 repeat-like protein [Thelephora terrestris]